MKEPWKGFVFLDVDDGLLQDSHDLGYGLILRKAKLDEILERDVEFSFRYWLASIIESVLVTDLK